MGLYNTPRIKHLAALLDVEPHTDKDIVAGINLKHKGLIKPTAKRYYGGRKVYQDLILPAPHNTIAVRIRYEDVIENGRITAITKTTTYYCDEDEGLGEEPDLGFIWYTKVDREVVRNEIKLKRSRIAAAYDYIVESGIYDEDPAVRQLFSTLLAFFATEIQLWQLGDGTAFETKLNAADLPAGINTMLNQFVNAEGKKVKDFILEQVTATPYDA